MTYILIFLGFLVVVFFLQKSSRAQLNQSVKTSQKNNPLRDLSSSLGLQFEEMKSPNKKDTFYSIGGRSFGEYKGIPLEIRFESTAELGNGVGMVYSYTLEKTVTFTVKNPQKKSFDIVPKRAGVQAGIAQNPRFDEKLILVGDAIIPTDILDYFASLGWMHLTLKDSSLTLHDTFYEQFQGISGKMNMIKAEHPIWKNTIQNGKIDEASARTFFDTLIDLSKRSHLV